jgi:pectate lyase-like protein
VSIALDRRALAEARRLPGLLSRCDETINQLPALATPLATDLVAIWHNGQTYQVPASAIAAFSGLTPPSFSTIPVFNVRSYGALGNGTTDDTAAFNAAIAAAAVNGGRVYAPAGTYAISSTLTFGNGSPTSNSTYWNTYLVGDGSGGGVIQPVTAPDITRLLWIGPGNVPFMKILGPIVGENMQGFLLDCNNGLCQDGIWEINMHGSVWTDVFVWNFARAGHFRTTWTSESSGFVEGASSNVFINCGGSNVLTTTTQKWLIINGGNPNDPTDRTSITTGDPFNSTFIKCRWRADAAVDCIGLELRFSDSNVFLHCDLGQGGSGANSFGLVVAQNPNFTVMPYATFYYCAVGTYATIGPITGIPCLIFWPLDDFVNNVVTFGGQYFPWMLAMDRYGNQPKEAGFRQSNISLRAVDRTAHSITPGNTAFTPFPLTNKFQVYQGDLYGLAPGLSFWIGQRLKISIRGQLTTTATPGNVQMQILLGTVLVAQTGTVALAASTVGSQFLFEVECFVATVNLTVPTATTATVTQLCSKMAFTGASSNAGLLQIAPIVSGGSSTAIPSSSNIPIVVQAAFSIPGQTAICEVAAYWVEYPDSASLG